MNIDQFVFQVEHSATLKLLRSNYAALALGFFQLAFKAGQKLQIPYFELKDLLEKYLAGLDEVFRRQFPNPAEHYLDLWSDEQHRFLRKYYELENDELLTELTYDSERALEWLQNLDKKDFVATQSRFLSIFENMKRVVDQTNIDPEERLAFLKEQRKKIDDEIKQVQTSGKVRRMDSTQIRERFLGLLEDSRKLISEFRLVEDIFKDLARQVKEQKLKESIQKGEIVKQVLDAHELLEESDQGKSFNAFWNFLISDESQTQLRELSEKILEVPEIQDFVRQNPTRRLDSSLRKLKSQLLQVGQRALRSKFRLSEELRKLLHQRVLAENKRVLEEIFMIKKLLLENKNSFLVRRQQPFTHLEFLADVSLPFARPLWAPSRETEFKGNHLELNPTAMSDKHEVMSSFLQTQAQFSQSAFHEKRLEEQIARELVSEKQISLSGLTKRYPLSGVAEIISYFHIAARNPAHMIYENQLELLEYSLPLFDPHQNRREILVPQIIFGQSMESTQ